MALNQREQSEFDRELNAVVSGESMRGKVEVVRYLQGSKAFQEGRVDSFSGDLEPMAELADRVNRISAIDPRVGNATRELYRNIGNVRNRREGSIGDRLVKASIMPLESVIMGAKILRAISEGFGNGSMSRLAQTIVNVDNGTGSVSRFNIRERQRVDGLSTLLLGTDSLTQEEMKKILAPYMSGLRLLEISERLTKTGAQFADLSRRSLQRSVSFASQINPNKAAQTQEKLNTILEEIYRKQEQVQRQIPDSTRNILDVGVTRQSPEEVKTRLEIGKQIGGDAKDMAKMLAERKKASDYIRRQNVLSAKTLTSFVEGVIQDTTSNMAANLGAVTEIMGQFSVVNAAFRQAVAASAAIKVATHLLIDGNLENPSEIEDYIEGSFRQVDEVIRDGIVNRHPELPLPNNLVNDEREG